MELKIIARIYTDFDEKFGIPRQSGISPESIGKIVFEKEYRRPEAVRGLTEYSHIWLIWQFSMSVREKWSPTVRPPRLGGNKKMGVFATRSPYRPNPIALSSVKLEKIVEDTELGPVLIVKGADILNGTPIYDIKPYLKYTDSHPDAVCGFADDVMDYKVRVLPLPKEIIDLLGEQRAKALVSVLETDPRPGYKRSDTGEYGMKFSGFDISFSVTDGTLSVTGIEKAGCAG